MTSEHEKTCEERIEAHMRGRIEDLRAILDAMYAGKEEGAEDIGSLYAYGLSVDYVAAGTFKGQEEGYLRYQLSWGGPSDEFRFYLDRNGEPTSIRYHFMDWFDGASRDADYATVHEWFDWYAGAVDVRAMVQAHIEDSW